jgi:pimeloyl-ACP methyl ester carboxylesterase
VSPVTATTDMGWSTEDIPVAGSTLRLRKGGAGDPIVVLPHDIGSLDRLPFYDALARRFTVYVPSHPGYDGAERSSWMRSVRDVAVTYQSLLAEMNLANPSLVGLGFGGWIAAEMATMSPQAFRRLVLVGAMGVKPVTGEILDQALVSYIDYVRAGFEDQGVFDRLFGAEPPTERLEQWDLNREMTFVWGRGDKIVPLECGEAYARALPRSRLAVVPGSGHFVDMEQPEALARLIVEFAAEG